jgi:hypothetical protein
MQPQRFVTIDINADSYRSIRNLKLVWKAYDNIPHELLLSKLEANGITEHLLPFLKALYRDSIVQVITGEAPSI